MPKHLTLILLILTALILPLGCSKGAGSPEDAVHGFTDAINARDAKAAAEFVSTAEIKEGREKLESMPEEAIKAQLKMSKEELKNLSDKELLAKQIEMMFTFFDLAQEDGKKKELKIEILETKIDGNNATVKTKDQDGKEDTVKLTLEDGSWKLKDLN